MTTTIDSNIMSFVPKYLDIIPPEVEVHTVTVTTNGAHGGCDVIVEGTVGENFEEYKRTWELH